MTRSAFHSAVALVALLCCLNALGQGCVTGVTVEPQHPTPRTPVTLNFVGPGLDDNFQKTTVVVSGNQIEVTTDFTGAITWFDSNRHLPIGELVPGNYTVRIHHVNAGLTICGSFEVTAVAEAPTVSALAQIIMLMSLAAAAISVLALRPGG